MADYTVTFGHSSKLKNRKKKRPTDPKIFEKCHTSYNVSQGHTIGRDYVQLKKINIFMQSFFSCSVTRTADGPKLHIPAKPVAD